MSNTPNEEPVGGARRRTAGAPAMRLGDLLVSQGYLKQPDLERALEIQKEETELRDWPLGKILVKRGALKEKDLEDLLNHSDLRKHVGTMAVKKGLINNAQLRACLMKKSSDQMIGEVLIDDGLLTEKDVDELLEEQVGSPRLGDLAVKQKLITSKDLEEALRVQKSPRRLGEILCDLELINPLDLNNILQQYNKQSDVGDILLAFGYIDKQQLSIARQESNYTADPLGKVLIRKRFISKEQYYFALSKQYNIPFKDMANFNYQGEDKNGLIRFVGQKYAERKTIIPISLKEKKLTLAMFRLEEMLQTIYEIQGMNTNVKIECILITEQKFIELFELLYGVKPVALDSFLEEEEEDTGDDDIDFMELNLDEEMSEGEGDGPVYGAQDLEAEELVNYIIKYGIINGASDIHLEQDRKGVKLRYRLDGVLREANVPWLKQKLREKAGAIVSRIKVMSNLDIAERRLPQDGVFRINYYDKAQSEKFDLDFRVATCLAAGGENVTIRILDSRKANVGLENLNHSQHVLDPFRTLLKSSAGMILVCGPTGSGKSSTLYAALQYVHNPGIKIITVEDPIEYNFPGIMQTQVLPKINLTFARLLRSFLRFDPDIILVGETRDEETAKISFDAAQTGHLLLSTLHTNDAVASVSRLLDLNVEYGQIASSLMCSLAQRLVRKICPTCIQEDIPGEDEWGILFGKYPSHLQFFRGEGCDECNFTGYQGRTLLSEIFVVDSDIAKALIRGHDEERIKRLAVDSGMKSMLEDGLLKLDQTTLSEILRVVPHEMIKEFRMKGKAWRKTSSLEEGRTGGPVHAEDSVSGPVSFHLTDPEQEIDVMDRILEAYNNLHSQNGGGDSSFEPSLFREFVATSFHQICQQFACDEVTFSVGTMGAEGAVEIAAYPGT
jgi:type II secretory ATPase GspE/PulE/Tfp pilus assembly ATPase PilB-like protein